MVKNIVYGLTEKVVNKFAKENEKKSYNILTFIEVICLICVVALYIGGTYVLLYTAFNKTGWAWLGFAVLGFFLLVLFYLFVKIGSYIGEFKVSQYCKNGGEIREKELNRFEKNYFPAGLRENREIEEIDQAIKNCEDGLKKQDDRNEKINNMFMQIITALGSGILIGLIPVIWNISNCQNKITIELFFTGFSLLIAVYVLIFLTFYVIYKISSPKRKLNRQLKDLKDLKESYVKHLDNSNKSNDKK